METFSALLANCGGNSPVTGEFPHKGQWRGAFMLSLIFDGWDVILYKSLNITLLKLPLHLPRVNELISVKWAEGNKTVVADVSGRQDYSLREITLKLFRS